MKIQRLSFDMNYHDAVSRYERKRISLMGAHVEKLMFHYGLDSLKITNCNFIHLQVNSQKVLNDFKLPSGENEDHKVVLNLFLEYSVFFSSDADGQLRLLLDIVVNTLGEFLLMNNLNTKLLGQTYRAILENDFFLPFSEAKGKNKLLRINATPLTRYQYNKVSYKVSLNVKNRINYFSVCDISPIYVPAEHPNVSTDLYVLFPDIIGWIDNNTFRITCGHKEYNYLVDEMTLKVIEHEELKSKLINWESVH